MGFLDKLRTIWHGTSMGATAEQVSAKEAEDAMAAAADALTPSEARRRSEYAEIVAAFVGKWQGKDAPSEAYGPQSPALIQEFMQEFQPGWRWDFGNAVDLADHPDVLPGFYQVPVGTPLRFGDILVFKTDFMRPFGNVGIVMDPDTSMGNVTVFTQHATRGALRAQEPMTIAAVFRRNHANPV
ncbi:protease [Arthrobacter phage Chipper1996]|uniref:Protease n=2 Tax=Klausavirus princesstrina TaxID=1984784 RepID=A0A286N4C1_9CAUD|nr:protease [Arthrobacter phage Tophat]QBP30482.1 protease [Arthrobacter phage Chipper1996]